MNIIQFLVVITSYFMNVLLLKFGFEHGYGIMCAGDLPYAVCYVYVLCSGMMLHLIVVCTGWKL